MRIERLRVLARRPGRRWLLFGVALAIVFQLAVLAVEYLGSVWPLWFGQPVRLATLPVDPRSLFRGNYVRLNYAIGRIGADVAMDCRPRQGQRVYLRLRREAEHWTAAALACEQPGAGLFIRGRVVGTAPYRLRYGIEAYFLPKQKAKAVERALVGGATALVYLQDNGRAAISALECKGGGC